MNLAAVYGTKVAESASRAGALALVAGSLNALPASANPLDTIKELKASNPQKGASNDRLIFFLLAAILLAWILLGKRRRG